MALSLIQGLTEFLPLSSSAHLVIAQKLLGIKSCASEFLGFVVWLHLATSIGASIYFAKDIIHFLKKGRMWLYIVIVDLITGGGILAAKSILEESFGSLTLAGGCLIITGMLLLKTKSFLKKTYRSLEMMNIKDILFMAIVQIFAGLPGISRSGVSIFALLSRKIKPQDAFKFSFISALPLMWGGFFVKWMDIKSGFLPVYIQSFVLAIIVSIASLKILSRVLNLRKFFIFGYYCLGLGLVVLITKSVLAFI